MSAANGMGPYVSWHVGMKVVCLKDYSWLPSEGGYFARCTYPVLGRVYTIRRIGMLPAGMGILLTEIVNPIGDPRVGFDGETGFSPRSFRLVQPRKTSIAIFERMLTPTREPVDA